MPTPSIRVSRPASPRRAWSTITAAVVAAVLSSGCDSPTSPKLPTTPPEFPSPTALELDVSFFHTRAPAPGGTTEHWEMALARIPALEDQVVRPLAVPLAILKTAARQEAEHREKRLWEWTFQVQVDGVDYDGTLLASNHVIASEWVMTVSAPDATPPLSEYVLLSGVWDHRYLLGTWLLHDVENASSNVVRTIEWYHDVTTPGMPIRSMLRTKTGTVVEFTREDSVWTVLFSSAVQSFGLLWDTKTGKGALSTATDLVCWDENLHDTACEPSVMAAAPRPGSGR